VLRALGDPAAVAARLHDDLLDQLAASGTAEQVVDALSKVAGTGVDSIAVAPVGPDPDEQLRLLAEEVAPAFRAARR
jgi:hypothetical protein